MIKLTQIQSDLKTNKYVVIIPGGPGLSSLTLRSLDLLKRSLNLVYVDFHGTNDIPYQSDATFDELVFSLEKTLSLNFDSESEIFLVGHSFGGLFAAALAKLPLVKALFFLGVPFSTETVSFVNDCYAKNMNSTLSKAEKLFDEKGDDQSFKEWLAEYGEMYFLKPEGRGLLLNDKVSAKFFLANSSDIKRGDDLLSQISSVDKLKVAIAGKQDKLIPSRAIQSDAVKGNFKFVEVDNASHFMTFDQAEKVASLIENNIATIRG